MAKTPNFNPITYLTEVKQELAKVTWPTRQQTIELTMVVIVISAIIAAFMGAADYVFNEILAWLIRL